MNEIREPDKRILEEMALDFGRSFLSTKIIGLCGVNRQILYFFRNKLRDYILEKGGTPIIVFTHSMQNRLPKETKKLDVDHFFRVYSTLGMNPHYLIDN